MARCIRWSENDRYLWPFTFSREIGSNRHLAAVLSSGDDDHRGCRLRLSAFGLTLIVALPAFIQPWQKKVIAESWDEETIKRLGRNWYYDTHQRDYGLSYCEGHLSLYYGRQTHDSSTDQRWGTFLPWTQWRHVRSSLYGLHGEHFWTEPKRMPWDYKMRTDAEQSCPARTFAFADFDGEQLTARTIIEEREWRFGCGYFKWLSLFRRPKIRRSLDIQFSGETGDRKGSWKGGTIGHGIAMLPGELHEAAFRRYCAEHKMIFVGE